MRHSDYIDISSGQKAFKNKKFSFKTFFLILLSIILLIIIGVIGYFWKVLKSVNYDTGGVSTENLVDLDAKFSNDTENYEEVDINSKDLINSKSVLNVLLFGSDTRSKSDNGRSDSIILMSVNTNAKKIKLISIMRDIWLKIPGYYSERINAAYSIGGANLAVETFEKNFGIRIDRYAMTDFENFAKIVDTLGGIDIELTASEVKYINNIGSTDLSTNKKIKKNLLKGAGIQHLNGTQALQHARNRSSLGSDYDRTKRQRNVVSAIINKFKDANIIQITKIISEIAPMITTNFNSNEITKLATNCLSYLKYSTEQFRIPTDDNIKDKTISGKMVLIIPDIQKARTDLINFIYEGLIKNSK